MQSENERLQVTFRHVQSRIRHNVPNGEEACPSYLSIKMVDRLTKSSNTGQITVLNLFFNQNS